MQTLTLTLSKNAPTTLWKNSNFLINLPFKKNKDVNPSKTSHFGMNPKHLLLAQNECLDLLHRGLIELSGSQWAYKAFYVNKQAEQNKRKMRLVINYQSLN